MDVTFQELWQHSYHCPREIWGCCYPITAKWSKKHSLLLSVAENTCLPCYLTGPGAAYAFLPAAVNLTSSACWWLPRTLQELRKPGFYKNQGVISPCSTNHVLSPRSAVCYGRSGRVREPLQFTHHNFAQGGSPRPRLLHSALICTIWADQHQPNSSQRQQTYYASVNAGGTTHHKHKQPAPERPAELEKRFTVSLCAHTEQEEFVPHSCLESFS